MLSARARASQVTPPKWVSGLLRHHAELQRGNLLRSAKKARINFLRASAKKTPLETLSAKPRAAIGRLFELSDFRVFEAKTRRFAGFEWRVLGLFFSRPAKKKREFILSATGVARWP